MHRTRLFRFGLYVGAIGATLLIAGQMLLSAHRVCEPIAIGSQPGPASIERAFSELVFERPVGLMFPPDGSNRLVVITQAGDVLLFSNDPGTDQATVMLNLQEKVIKERSNEEGLLGLAFHPEFHDNRQFYVFYTNTDHVGVLSRFRMSQDDPNPADPGSEQVLLRTPQGTGNHNGGTIVFGPDGFLYLAIGDGGPIHDPRGNGQNLATVLGKVLRIDVDRRDPGLEYAVPPDNPFIGRDGARGEIWATGLRNVWRMAFDRQTGRLWGGDVGDDTWEEVDILVRGGNYGWNLKEGFRAFANKDAEGAPASSLGRQKLIDPVFAYHHAVGNCIVGGVVYRGRRVPELFGAYLFADHVTGQVYALQYDETRARAISVLKIGPPGMPVYSFGEDESGEAYFTTSQGVINRLSPLPK